MSKSGRVEMIQGVVYVAGLVTLVVALQTGPEGAVLAYAIAVGLATLLTIRWLQRLHSLRPTAIDIGVLRRAVTFGYRGTVGVIVQFFTYRLDLILVNLWVGITATGHYAIAARIGEVLWMLPSAVGAVVFTMSARDSTGDINSFVPKAFWVTALAGLVCASAIVILGPVAIPIVFSSSFEEAYAPLLVLLPGCLLLGSSSVLANDLAGRGQPGKVSIAAVIAFGSTLALDIVLIPLWGIQGAAIASTLSYSLYFFAILYSYLRVTGMGWRFLLLAAKNPQ